MSIRHHPSSDTVAAFAAGNLDRGQHVVTATHLAHCAACRARAAAAEHIGGAVLTALPPAPMAADALARAAQRLDEAAPPAPPPRPEGLADVPGLPSFVRRLAAGEWRWIAPGLHVRHLDLGPSATRAFLLRSRAGARFLRHTHTGFEMTCVLTGSFTHDGARYAAGDFDLGTPDVIHEIEIGREGPCVSLVAMQGVLKMPGFLGRLLQPLIRL